MKFDIEGYARDNLEKMRLTSTGEITAECPWCGKYGGFYINKETGNFVCFKCDERGRHLVGVVARVEGLDWQSARTYILRNAVQFRRRETTSTLLDKIRELRPDTDNLLQEPNDVVNVPLPDEFVSVYDDKRDVWRYPVYLKERKVKRNTAREWGLGYCVTGRYAMRVIVPIECPGGCSFTARDSTGQLKPKILNPKDANHRQLLLGWNHIPEQGDIAIVEGPFDAIKLWQYGIPALAVMGKILHSAQLVQIFSRSPDSAIVVMLDPEESLAPFEVAKQLACRVANVSIARLPDGIDPGSATAEQAHEAYNEALPFTGDRTGRLSAVLRDSRKKMLDFYDGG